MGPGGCLPLPRSYIHVYDQSIETAWPIKAKLYVEHPLAEGLKVCINGQGHMTKMAAMTINSKKPLKSSSSEPEGYDFETWYEASGNGAPQSLYKS